MDPKKLGNELKKLRKKNHSSQEDVYRNILNQAAVSRIEQGKHLPRAEKIPEIAEAFNIPIHYLFEASTIDDYDSVLETREKIRQLMIQTKYADVLKIVESELHTQKYDGEYKQYLEYHLYGTSYFLKKKSYDECIFRLNQILRDGTFTMNPSHKAYFLHSIAVIHYYENNYTAALRIYKEILDNKNQNRDIKFLVLTCFNFANLLYDQRDYEQSIEVAKQGIEFSRKGDYLPFIGHFHFQIGDSLVELKHSEGEILENFERALLYFKDLKREDLIETLKENFPDYYQKIEKDKQQAKSSLKEKNGVRV